MKKIIQEFLESNNEQLNAEDILIFVESKHVNSFHIKFHEHSHGGGQNMHSNSLNQNISWHAPSPNLTFSDGAHMGIGPFYRYSSNHDFNFFASYRVNAFKNGDFIHFHTQSDILGDIESEISILTTQNGQSVMLVDDLKVITPNKFTNTPVQILW